MCAYLLVHVERFKLEEKIGKNTLLPEDSKVVFLILTTAFVAFIVYMYNELFLFADNMPIG